MQIIENLKASQNYLAGKTSIRPDIALVLGSGLGGVVDIIENKTVIPYKDIPHFPVSTVHGHAGQLVFGKLEGREVVAMQGRVHFYEGHPMSVITYPIRLMKKLGCFKLILTSAVGGINESYAPGDAVVITDHINFMGANPLIGEHCDDFGQRFPDMSRVYSSRLAGIAIDTAKKMNIRAHTGVYFASTGPSYETPSEVRAFAKLGGDVVGMSVVPEAIVASQSGIELLCLSYVSNMASGISKKGLSHEEVMEVGREAGGRLSKLIAAVVKSA